MAPMDDASLITDTSMFRPGLIVTDVVYNPEETKLLREAKAAGCTTFDGLGMLVGQARRASSSTPASRCRLTKSATPFTDK